MPPRDHAIMHVKIERRLRWALWRFIPDCLPLWLGLVIRQGCPLWPTLRVAWRATGQRASTGRQRWWIKIQARRAA